MALAGGKSFAGSRIGSPNRTCPKALGARRARFLVVVPFLLLGSGCGEQSARSNAAEWVAGSFGEQGLASGQFFYPRAIATSQDGHIFIADKTGRIQRFDANGKFERLWHTPKYEAGMPVGMTVSPDGRLFVADTHYHRVLIYDLDGKLLGQFGREGTGPGEFLLVTDVAVDRRGNIYVSECGGNDRISKFNAEYKFLKSFGGRDAGEASLNRPVGLTIDEQGTLWVADAVHHRLVQFSLDGKYLRSVGAMGDAPGEFKYPYDTALLPDGTLIVAEYGNHRLQQVSKEGRSLRLWGGPGWELGKLAYPWGVAVVKDRVYVVDSGNNRVQIVRWPSRTKQAD